MPFCYEYLLDNEQLKDQSDVGWKWGVRVAFADARKGRREGGKRREEGQRRKSWERAIKKS